MVSTNDEVVNDTVSATEVQQALAAEIKPISEEDFEKAQKTFQQGKKNLFLNKYDESVNNIGEACKIYTSKYGEFDSHCAEVYFFYGKALLELARVENNVLGNALNGVPEDNEPIDDSRYGNPEDVAAEEKKEISDKVIEALCDSEEQKAGEKKESGEEKMETTTAAAPAPSETEINKNKADDAEAAKKEEKKSEECGAAEKKSEESSEVVEAKKEDKKEETAAAPAVTNGEETVKSTEAAAAAEENGKKKEGEEEAGGDDEEDGDDEAEDEDEGGEDLTKNDEQAKDEAEAEDISNLQRSWEMFELAKLVYTKNFDNDLLFKNKRIAECLLKLGEISIEQEIYEQAINDINESIKLQEEQKEQRDDRMLAESFYQLGLAQQFNNQFSEANESYQKSINILQIKIEKLKGKLMNMGDDADAELEKNTIKDEIAELETLLPEMTSKLEEVTEQGQQSLNLIKEAKECFLNNMEAKSNGDSANGSASGAAAGATSTNGDVKDITSLVKSKRKICGSPANENGSVKKTRLSDSDECVNGNGNGNGKAAAENGGICDEDKIEVDEKMKTEEEVKMNGSSEKPAAIEEEAKKDANKEEEKMDKEMKPIESSAAASSEEKPVCENGSGDTAAEKIAVDEPAKIEAAEQPAAAVAPIAATEAPSATA